jgi:S-layer protein
MSSGGTLVLNGAGTAYTVSNTAFTTGTSDVLNLTLTDGSGAGVAFASTGITASGVETVAITTADTQTTPSGTFNDSVTLLGNSAKTITVAGNAGLTLTATDTAATTVDASGITTGGFTFTSGALAAAATIKGSAAGTNTVDFSAATKAVTYTGGTGADVIAVTNSQNNVITLGDGANTVNNAAAAGNGNNTVTGGKDADVVKLGTGNNVVSLGDGANTFIAGSGNNTYTGGSGVDTITLGGGKNTVTTGTGADVVTFTAVVANGNSYTTITDPHSGLKITFTDAGQSSGTSTFTSAAVSLADTAVFQDYLDAAVAGDGSTNSIVRWFQYNGNTYIVEDNSVASTFQNAGDTVVKLTGLVDLSTATFAAVATTSTSLTLA